MTTLGQILAQHAERLGMPRRSLTDVRAALADAKARSKGKNKDLDKALASLMLRHGRLTDEARAYVEGYGR